MSKDFSAKAIVVVEDDLFVRKYLQDLLSVQGYAVEAFETTEDARRAVIGDGRVALLIVDDSMPGVTGTELIIDLRRAGVGVPAILLGPTVASYGGSLAADFGRVEVVEKPFHSAQLLSAIDRMLTP